MNGGMDTDSRDEIYSIPVKAGKRTYFFDVKCTRNNDYYLTITESKKVGREDSTRNFEKHKIFLYKEDFDKFTSRRCSMGKIRKSATRTNPNTTTLISNEE